VLPRLVCPTAACTVFDSLDVPVLQQLCFFGSICPAAACDSLDVPVLHQPELTLDMYVLQQPLLPVDVSVLQLFMFNSCCRTDISGEDMSTNSRGLCKETRTGAAQAAI
jgi:hypothetical protein